MGEEKTEKRKYRLKVYAREGERILGSYDYVCDLPADKYTDPIFIKTLMELREEALQSLIKTTLLIVDD